MLLCRKQATKNLDTSPMAKNRPFFRFERRALDAAGNFSPPRSRIHLISLRPSSTFTDRPCPTRTGLAVGPLQLFFAFSTCFVLPFSHFFRFFFSSFFVVPSLFIRKASRQQQLIRIFPSTADTQPCDGPLSKRYYF